MHRASEPAEGKKLLCETLRNWSRAERSSRYIVERAFYSVVSRARYNHALCLARRRFSYYWANAASMRNSPSAVLVPIEESIIGSLPRAPCFLISSNLLLTRRLVSIFFALWLYTQSQHRRAPYMSHKNQIWWRCKINEDDASSQKIWVSWTSFIIVIMDLEIYFHPGLLF